EADERDHGQIVLRPRYEDLVITAKHRAEWQGNLKLVYEPNRTGVRLRLYDLAADPTQTHELGPDHPAAAPMKKALREWLVRDPERELDVAGRVVRRND